MIMKKYYTVKNGSKVGVFDNWNDVQKNIDNFEYAIYRSFNTLEEAQDYLNDPLSYIYDDKNIFVKFEDNSHNFELNSEKLSDELKEFIDDESIRHRLTEIIQKILTDRLQKNLDGVEDTEVDEDDFISQPYNPDQVKYLAKEFPVGTLYNYITGFEGEEEPTIDMRPGFQRNFVWTNKAKSSLIESILLNIPIPSIYLNQTSSNRYLPADGLQRLNAISSFLSGELKLSGLEYLIQFNGYKYKKRGERDNSKILPIDIKRRIRDYSVNCNIIDSDTPDEVKLDIFKRLNSSGIKLNPQELRNSVTTDLIRDLYSKIETDEYFKLLVMNEVNTNRFAHHEFILRFYGAYYSQMVPVESFTYEGNIKKFLDKTLVYMKNQNTSDLETISELLKNTLRKVYHLFGSDAFRKPYTDRKGPLNTMLYTQLLVNCANIDYDSFENPGYLKDKFNSYLSKNLKFWLMISSGTNAINNIQEAGSYIKKFLDEEGLL